MAVFTVANIFSILWSWLRLSARRKVKDTTRSVTADGIAKADTPKVCVAVKAGFNLQGEIAKLAERIVEPVVAKLAVHELEHVIDRIRNAFEQFTKTRAAADTDFESMAINVLEPVQPKLSDAEFTRLVDRLRGAMVGFCQTNDWGQSVA
jgi:hypothetical protein